MIENTRILLDLADGLLRDDLGRVESGAILVVISGLIGLVMAAFQGAFDCGIGGVSKYFC